MEKSSRRLKNKTRRWNECRGGGGHNKATKAALKDSKAKSLIWPLIRRRAREKERNEKKQKGFFSKRSACWICKGICPASTCWSWTRGISLTLSRSLQVLNSLTNQALSLCSLSLFISLSSPTLDCPLHTLTNTIQVRNRFNSSSCEPVCRSEWGWVERENWQGGRVHMLSILMLPNSAQKRFKNDQHTCVN